MNRYALDRIVLGLSEKDLGFGEEGTNFPSSIGRTFAGHCGKASSSANRLREDFRDPRYFQAKRNTSPGLVDQNQGFARIKGGNEIGSAIIVQVLSEQGPAVSLKKDTAFTLHQGPNPPFPSPSKRRPVPPFAAGFGLHGKSFDSPPGRPSRPRRNRQRPFQRGGGLGQAG